MRKSGFVAPALAMAALCAGSVASAQEEPVPPRLPPRPQEEPPPPPIKPRDDTPIPTAADGRPVAIDPTAPGFFGFALGDLSEQLVVGNERVVAATGGLSQPLSVKLPGFELRCRSAVLWGDRDQLVEAIRKGREELAGSDPEKILGPLLHAVYAEGDVYVKMQKQTIRADRVYLDFQKGKAYLVQATMTADIEGHKQHTIPLTIRADVIRATSRHKYTAENARFTSCNYADPHFEFVTDRVAVGVFQKGFA